MTVAASRAKYLLESSYRRWSSFLGALDQRLNPVIEGAPASLRSRLPLALVCLGFASSLLPLFAGRHLPLVDLPTHLAIVSSWTHMEDPAWALSDYYELNLGWVPYWGYYGFLRLGAEIAPLHLVNKLYLIVTFALFYWGLRAWLRAHGRDELLTLAAVPLLWSFPLGFGFLAYWGGVALLPVTLAKLARHRSGRGSRRDVFMLVLLGVVTALFHPLALLLFVIATLVYLPSVRAWVAIPGLAVLASMSSGASKNPKGVYDIQGMWRDPLTSLENFFENWTFAFTTNAYEAWLFAAIAMAVALSWALRAGAESSVDRKPFHFFAAMVLTYLCMPQHMAKPIGFAMITPRLPMVVIASFLAVAASGRLLGWRRLVLGAPLLAMGLGHGPTLYQRMQGFAGEVEDFQATLDPIPQGAKTLTLVYDNRDDVLGTNLYHKFPSYVQMEKGGFNPLIWDKSQGIGQVGFPLKSMAQVPHPPEGGARAFSWSKHGRFYDYFVTRREPAAPFSRRPDLELLSQNGSWRLWKRSPVEPRRRSADDPDPPGTP